MKYIVIAADIPSRLFESGGVYIVMTVYGHFKIENLHVHIL